MSQKITFDNTRVFQGRVAPIQISSFKDRYGVVRRFKDIPLNKPDGTPDTYPGEDGKILPVTYGQALNFSGGRRSITFDSVVHEHVINAVRQLPECASSHNGRKIGAISEREPEVVLAKAYAQSEAELQATVKFAEITAQADPTNFHYACALLGVQEPDRKAAMPMALAKIKQDPTAFLSLFTSKGTFKPEKINQAIVSLGRTYGLINFGAGLWYFGDLELGDNLDKVSANAISELKKSLEGKLK